MSGNSKTYEEAVAAAMAEAKSRGLPEGWGVKFDPRRRRKWISPAGKTYDSLPKALAYAKKMGTIPPDSPLHGPPASSKKRSYASSSSSPGSKRLRTSSRQSSNVSSASADSEKKAKSASLAAEEKRIPEPEVISQQTATYSTVTSAEESIYFDDTEPDPDTDPETVYDHVYEEEEDDGGGGGVGVDGAAGATTRGRPSRPTTVHWNPHSVEGKKVGYRIRILDGTCGKWKGGRVVRYDGWSNKHKVKFDPVEEEEGEGVGGGNGVAEEEERWMRLKEEVVQCGSRFVWALVKGFAWWPAQVLECEPPTSTDKTGYKEGYVYVEFFGADQVATIKDTPDFIRPFDYGKVDDFMMKNKKKRNAKAVELAREELERTRQVRNEAVRYYAERSFAFANRRAGGLLGRRIEFFRGDVNYPYGDTVRGVVRQYSASTKKYLVSYEPSTKTKVKYEAGWVNVRAKEANYKLIDDMHKPLFAMEPTEEDLEPYTFDHWKKPEIDSEDGGCLVPTAAVSPGRCMGCLEYLLDHDEITIMCGTCNGTFHPGCVDPPLSSRVAQRTMDDGDCWLCTRCTPCVGCHKLDKAFGCRTQPVVPSTLYLEDGGPLELCSMCVPLYEKDRFCANCGHTWDDVRYQKTQRSIRWQNKLRSEAKLKKKRKGSGGGEEGGRDDDDEEDDVGNSGDAITATAATALTVRDSIASTTSSVNTAGASSVQADSTTTSVVGVGNNNGATTTTVTGTLDPSWFYPDSLYWGYNEGSMLICDSCNLWVHAGCANLTREEYEQTNAGEHPIYSKEFLCYICCKKRCVSMIETLQNEDAMMLFAMPVTEHMAPTYRDVIKNPMDLETMTKRAKGGSYHNYAWVRSSFELMVLNALTFNRTNSKYWNEAKRYYHVCMDKVILTKCKGAQPSKYTEAIHANFNKARREVEMELERVQEDSTTTKKDLVAGAQFRTVELPPLSNPIDPESCIPCTDLQLKFVDAHYSAWLDTCFSCGSSGASDTFLFCVDCGEAYHSFCAGAPIHSMDASAVSGWRCANCKICEITGDVPDDESRLLYCEMCDRAFTLDLLDPPLKSAPTGLWICGQCVDCRTCHNRGERGRVSVKYWSRDPYKCFRCGGCKGLVEKHIKGMRCGICSKIWRKEDGDLAQCKSCKVSVHARCDVQAERFLRRKGEGRVRSSAGGSSKADYECPQCRRKHEEQTQAELLRKQLRDQAWIVILRGCIAPHDEMTFVELHEKLSEETEWRMKNMWREEYRSLILGGKRVLAVVEEKLGERFELPTRDNKEHKFPIWMASRASRFVRCAKRSRWEGEKFGAKTDIRTLVLMAKLASAFLHVACKCLGLNIKKNVKHWERMKQLLTAASTSTGTIELPPDSVKSVGNRQIISEEDWRSKYWDENAFDSVVKSSDVLGNPSSSASPDEEEATTRRAEDESLGSKTYKSRGGINPEDIQLPQPMRGWDEQLNPRKSSNRWKDPRTCCLCHTCGDDDAGVIKPHIIEEGDEAAHPPNTDNNTVEVGRAGRLLPMSSGLFVHASCALWSSEVWESLDEGLIQQMDKARYRGSKLKCFGCGRAGATLGCYKTNCSCNYHFPCAKACGAVFTAKQEMFCRNHKKYALKDGVMDGESYELMKPLKIADTEKDHHAPPPSSPDGIATKNLCFRLGSLVVHSLGKIEQNSDGFHSKNYITPPGYVATRIYWSFRTPRRRTLYILKIDGSSSTQQQQGSSNSNNNGGSNRAVFSITPADDPKSRIRGRTATEVYNTLVTRVLKMNRQFFSQRDLFSVLPMVRVRGKKAYGLNGPQFFGFGLNHIRKHLESSPGAAAVVVPLTNSSPAYNFCFTQPEEETLNDLQRKRAAADAEKALENASGSARTEGMSAVARSGGSGRITRALVRCVDEDNSPPGSTASGTDPSGSKGGVGGGSGGGRSSSQESKSDVDSNQTKYREMKSTPMDQRLAARRSHIHGWGLFTKIDLPKHSMIVEYMGETVRQCIADKRERGYEMSGVGSCYMFRLDAQRIVDATTIGCMARFMNHCCRPNAYAKVITVDSDQGFDKKIVVFALRDIGAGEEITYDYKFPVEDGSLRCTCGAPNCIGRMN